MTPAEAYEIASQWGSYSNASDPGACFYAFPVGDARPRSEDHRHQCLWYVAHLLGGSSDNGDSRDDIDELVTLARFFRNSELNPQ